MSKIDTILSTKKDAFLTRILIATQLFAERFYAAQSTDWGKVEGDVAVKAEAQFNDPNSGVYGSTQFAATIKALTGQDIKLRNPRAVSYQVGVAVVPVAPVHGERTDDGYQVGSAYLCTNESSGGKFRNASNLDATGIRTTRGGVRTGDADGNTWHVMSPLSDEVRPATEEEIVALVNGLLSAEGKGLTMLQNLEAELSRYDHFIK